MNSRRTRDVCLYATIAVTGTIADAIFSYISIHLLQIAVEANPVLDAISSSIGFGGAMIFRTILGVAFILTLSRLALTVQKPRDLRATMLGLRVVAVVLTALTLYHGFMLGAHIIGVA